MEINIAVVVVVIIFAVVIVIAFALYKGKGSASISGPFGMIFSIKGENSENSPTPGIRGREIASREGGVLMEETTGQGIDVERVNAKDDVLLSSRRETHDHFSSALPGALSAQSLSAGGNITIQQYVSGGLPIAQQVAFFLQQLGLDTSLNHRFATSQYEAYSNIWRKLQALRLAGDDLWEEASNENLFEFAKQLRQVKKLVLEDDIYLDDKHRQELREVLRHFDQFWVGKKRLIDIRSKPEMERFTEDLWAQEEIRYQIQFNLEAKNKYERLLEKIRDAFRDKLATI